MQTHDRYYILRINKHGERSYRDSTGSWTLDFRRANLWGDLTFAQKKFKMLVELSNKYRQSDTLFIGETTVCEGNIL